MGRVDRRIEALERRRNGSGVRDRHLRRRVLMELEDLADEVNSLDADELAAYRETEDVAREAVEIEALLEKRRKRS